jgi:hypothetical protein
MSRTTTSGGQAGDAFCRLGLIIRSTAVTNDDDGCAHFMLTGQQTFLRTLLHCMHNQNAYGKVYRKQSANRS